MKNFNPLIQIAAVATIVFCAVAEAGPTAEVKRDTYACQAQDYFERTVRVAAQNDQRAFARLVIGGLSSGQCVMLKQGERVYVDEMALFAGLKLVRRRGALTTYWTYSEAVR